MLRFLESKCVILQEKSYKVDYDNNSNEKSEGIGRKIHLNILHVIWRVKDCKNIVHDRLRYKFSVFAPRITVLSCLKTRHIFIF